MTLFTGAAIYLVLWWTILFAVLPLGNQTYHELGLKPPGGGDPGAPVNPDLKRKFLLTTALAAVAFVLLWAVLEYRLISLPDLPGRV